MRGSSPIVGAPVAAGFLFHHATKGRNPKMTKHMSFGRAAFWFLVPSAITFTVIMGLASWAGAQAITSDPIQTVPGYQGCGGNQTVQTVDSTITCANQRTFHFGAAARTVVAVSTMNPDGSASVEFTIKGGNAPLDVPVRVRSHVGISSGGTTDDQSGVIPQGTKGPVTLTFRYDCGQVDVKAVLTANGNENGRISGGYFCKPIVVTTTTTIAPTTAPGSSPPSAPVTSVSAITAGSTPVPAVVAPSGTLPETGGGSPALGIAGLVLLFCGSTIVILVGVSRMVARR